MTDTEFNKFKEYYKNIRKEYVISKEEFNKLDNNQIRKWNKIMNEKMNSDEIKFWYQKLMNQSLFRELQIGYANEKSWEETNSELNKIGYKLDDEITEVKFKLDENNFIESENYTKKELFDLFPREKNENEEWLAVFTGEELYFSVWHLNITKQKFAYWDIPDKWQKSNDELALNFQIEYIYLDYENDQVDQLYVVVEYRKCVPIPVKEKMSKFLELLPVLTKKLADLDEIIEDYNNKKYEVNNIEYIKYLRNYTANSLESLKHKISIIEQELQNRCNLKL